MSIIFFVASVINLYIFISKIYKLGYSEIGFLKRTIFVNLVALLIYNLMYSFESIDEWFLSFLDKFLNALMMSLVLFLNLVLIDAQTKKIQSNDSEESGDPAKMLQRFLWPKAAITTIIFINLLFF